MRNEVIGDRYRILDRLGEGGMAVVYTARDEKLDRVVAIKVLHEHLAKNEDIRQRFEQEARAISSLDHPNIVKVFDYSGPNSTQLWIVTELLKGQNLANFLRNFEGGKLNPIIAASIVREICKALEHAHSRDIVHRDIKPENVMVLDHGPVSIKLMDFGIAKNLHKNSMTLTGTFMGSPSYMSPEQIRGKGIDLRCDIYSLGVVLYELTTGRLPFIGTTTHDVILKIVEGNFIRPVDLVPETPGDIDRIICKAMASDAERRFQSGKMLGKELDLFLQRAGFVESHVELERYFQDRNAFEERLAAVDLASVETKHRMSGKRTTHSPRKAEKTSVERPDSTPSAPNRTRAGRETVVEPSNDDQTSENLTHSTRRAAPTHATPVPPQRRTEHRRKIPTQFHQQTMRRTFEPMNQGAVVGGQAGNSLTAIAANAQRITHNSQKRSRRRSVPRVPKTKYKQHIIVVRTAYRVSSWSFARTVAWIGIIAMALMVFFATWLLFTPSPEKKPIQPTRPESKRNRTNELPFAAEQTRPETNVESEPTILVVPQEPDNPVRSPKSRIRESKRTKPTARNNTAKKSVRAEANASSTMSDSSSVRSPAPIVAQPAAKRATPAEPARLVAEGTGQLRIVRSPPAVIFVDGKRRCTMPCADRELALSSGKHVIRAERTGFSHAEVEVNIANGQTTDVQFEFSRAATFVVAFNWIKGPVQLAIYQLESGALVTERVINPTQPFVDLPVGNYVFDIRSEMGQARVNVFNPGAGAKRIIANPFAGRSP
jgi:serine/threonine protein kinase